MSENRPILALSRDALEKANIEPSGTGALDLELCEHSFRLAEPLAFQPAIGRAESRERETKVERYGDRRFPLLLTEAERRRLERAVRESGAPSRSFFVFEAIEAGLSELSLEGVQERRSVRVEVKLAVELKERVWELAKRLGVGQQSLMRHFLHRYILLAPWRTIRSARPAERDKVAEAEAIV